MRAPEEVCRCLECGSAHQTQYLDWVHPNTGDGARDRPFIDDNDLAMCGSILGLTWCGRCSTHVGLAWFTPTPEVRRVLLGESLPGVLVDDGHEVTIPAGAMVVVAATALDGAYAIVNRGGDLFLTPRPVPRARVLDE